MTNDSISALFTRIRNASAIGYEKMIVSNTKINKSIVIILIRHGFIQSFKQITYPGIRSEKKTILSEKLCTKHILTKNSNKAEWFEITLKYENNKSVIKNFQRISRPGCRIYVPVHSIPQICGKLGVAILSTSRGIISDREAISFKIGGELLGFVS